MIVWTDIEATDLDERAGHLLEVALVVTDDNLVEVASTSVVVQPVGCSIDEVQMNDFVRKMHTANGLLDELRAGRGLRRHEAEESLIAFVGEMFRGVPDVPTDKCVHCGKSEKEHWTAVDRGLRDLPGHRPNACSSSMPQYFEPKKVSALSQTPLVGSTVAFDRRWLREHMTRLEAMFFYRSIDVSSLTELAKRWSPKIYEDRPRLTETHRALADARGSIALLRHYRERGFVG